MTAQALMHGLTYPPDNAGPIWKGSMSPAVVNEGDQIKFTLQVLNPVVGARIVWAMTNNKNSGNVTSATNYVEAPGDVIRRVLLANGLSVVSLTASSTPPREYAVDYLISIPPGSTYQGQVMEFVLTVKKNRRDDINPRSGQLMLLRKAFASDPDSSRGNGNFLSINDTSRKPAGTPTFSWKFLNPDGTATSKVNLIPGEQFRFRITTANIIPGTKLKIYASGAAQYFLKPGFRTQLLEALKAAAPNGVTLEQTKYPPPEGESWYNGYTMVMNDGYDNSGLDVLLTVDKYNEDGTSAQFDVQVVVAAEGTASEFDTTVNKGNWNSTSTYVTGDYVTYVVDGAQYIAIQGVGANIAPTNTAYWQDYVATQNIGSGGSLQFKRPPPRYWEIRAKTDGTTISYKVNVPIAAVGSTIRLDVTNTPAGFAAALAAAAADPNSPATYSGGYFTATANASFVNSEISWSVPHTGSGKHELVLSENGDQPITIGEACVFLTPLAPLAVPDPTYTVGVNNAVGEFGKVPGVYVTDYVYPSEPHRATNAHASMDYLWGIGCKVMRLPFKWGRIQRDGLFTPLSGEKPAGTPWNGTTEWDIARIDEIVAYWTGMGGTLLLDMHNYGGGPAGGKIGYDQQVPMEAWIDCWIRLASRYENNTRVWFGLMNEPAGAGWGATRCRENMQWMVNAIRRRTNCRNKILVAGQGYSSAGAWVSSGQADAFLDFYDPANNFAFEPHCYFDGDASGTTGTCSTNAQNRLVAITTWAKANGFKLFLGEVAGGDPTKDGQQSCGTVTPAAYTYMRNNKDAWLGWTTWGYGPRWPDTYMFKLTPADLASFTSQRPCMDMLFPYLTTSYT